MSKILKITLIFVALLSAFVLFPMMALRAGPALQPIIGGSVAPALAPSDIVTITVLHTNDFHGQLEASGSNPGIARVGYVISDVIRPAVGAENVVLLDGGDEMQGSLLSNLNKGAPVIDLFNFLGYQAAAFGNHEFDWGQQTLISRTQQAQYPFLSANIVVSDTGNCATAGWTSPSFTKPWITMTVGASGHQAVLGIVGVSTQETPYITIASATQGLCFKDPADSILHYYDAVKAAGADTIIVLSHLGNTDGGYGYGFPVYGDQTLARRLVQAGKPVALIIGGHSHTNLLAAQNISGTTVVQAQYNGRKVGRADIVIDTTADTAIVSWQPITITATAPENAAVKNRLALWTNDPAYQAQVKQPIGYTQVDLLRGAKSEGMMGDFVDDAIYNYLNNDGNPANDIDLFFNNAGGIRTDWCRIALPLPNKIYMPIIRGGAGGTVTPAPSLYTWSSNAADCHTGVYSDTPMLLTYGNMFTILPFGNATVVGKMTGAQIMDVVNYGPQVSNGVIQPAGLKYTYYSYTDTNPGPQPYAWGAYDVTVLNKTTGLYEPLVMTKTYSVGTNEFLAPAGGDGYNGFKYMTDITYWGDMLNAVNAWVSANYTITTPYKGPANDGSLDGRLVRNGGDTYNPANPTLVVPVNVLHHNDAHGRLLPAGSAPGYTNLVTLIKQERAHNPTRTILLNAGDTIQGDAMAAYYKAAFTGLTPDNQTLPPTLTVNPILKAMNALTYTAMTLGNHEYNYGNSIFTGTLGQANFPLLQANVYDGGAYGLAQVNVRPYVTVSLPGPAGNISLAVLGIGNHRIPNYELPSNIPGLTFTNPVTETQNRAPALQATNDAVIALTHIGFTTIPGSLEVDNNVDTYLAANSTGVDAIIGGHSHTNPSAPDAPYKFLPTFVGAQDNTPVIINQAYRYNTYLGEVVLGLLPKAGGGYEVVSRAGRYIANSTSTAQDAEVKAIIDPYDAFFQAYKNRELGQTTVPIDTTNAYITETNGADMQVDASLFKLNQVFGAGSVQGHLSGAMTNAKIAATATSTNPVTMTVNDMFTLMPYENSLVVYTLNGPQLKTILERAYRNYWYYRYGGSTHGGYSYYTTCMLDIDAGGIITYTNHDPLVYTTTVDHVGGLSFGGVTVDFLDATTYYTVSTVNYIAAGSCNFNNGGVTLWPFNQIVHDTQYYVRDVMIDYVPTLPSPITPVVENRIRGIP